MRHLPMDVPAEIHRWVESAESGQPGRSDIVVARGPLVIMAHGLMAIEAEMRDSFWIASPLGELTASQVEETLRHWSQL